MAVAKEKGEIQMQDNEFTRSEELLDEDLDSVVGGRVPVQRYEIFTSVDEESSRLSSGPFRRVLSAMAINRVPIRPADIR